MGDDTQTLLYLVRHGEAKPNDEDPHRPLTEAGAREVARVAAWAASAGIQVDEIRHSGKLRAQQTAAFFAERLANAPAPQAVAGLAPNDEVEPVARQLWDESRRIMLVGHLPFLGRLASLLVAGDAEASVVSFHAGALLTLARNGGGWTVLALMQPSLLSRS